MTPPNARWHGPPSVLGVALGLLVAAVPFVLGLGAALYLVLLVVGPLGGALLLAVPGRTRQLGVGLLASGLAYPVGLASVLLAAAVIG